MSESEWTTNVTLLTCVQECVCVCVCMCVMKERERLKTEKEKERFSVSTNFPLRARVGLSV